MSDPPLQEKVESPEGWAILDIVNTAEEAKLLAGFLDSHGIPAQVESLLFSQEPVAIGLLGRVHVHVPEAELDRARRLVSEQLADPDRGGADGD